MIVDCRYIIKRAAIMFYFLCGNTVSIGIYNQYMVLLDSRHVLKW